MEVQVSNIFVNFGGTFDTGCGSLMDSHGISERAREEVVVADGDLGQYLRKRALLFPSQVDNGRNMTLVGEH